MNNTKCPRCGGVNLKWAPHRALGCSDCGWESHGAVDLSTYTDGGAHKLYPGKPLLHYEFPMKEYIEREALMGKQWDCRIADIDGETYGDLRDIADFIAEFPAADVMEVVRCKDCKHFGGHGVCHFHSADDGGTPIFVRETDFCSYGE